VILLSVVLAIGSQSCSFTKGKAGEASNSLQGAKPREAADRFIHDLMTGGWRHAAAYVALEGGPIAGDRIEDWLRDLRFPAGSRILKVTAQGTEVTYRISGTNPDGDSFITTLLLRLRPEGGTWKVYNYDQRWEWMLHPVSPVPSGGDV
jgi:hypothetical protein